MVKRNTPRSRTAAVQASVDQYSYTVAKLAIAAPNATSAGRSPTAASTSTMT
jgi:hypothetical protein